MANLRGVGRRVFEVVLVLVKLVDTKALYCYRPEADTAA
jgi:hypothetical protein